MKDWPADLRWLAGLCRYDLGGRAPVFDGVDAQAAVALAAAHRVTPIARRSWRALSDAGLAPPPPAALDERAARARRRSLLAAGHLVRLARSFEAEGVEWLALKGPALSTQLYGDPAFRVFRDLDVIVPPSQFAAAVRAAGAIGWSAPAQWEALQRITAHHDMEMAPTLPGQPLLELHHALGPRFMQFRLDPFAASAQERVTVAGAEIPTLSGPALASYVAWHGGRGLWYRLSWLLDCVRLMPRGADDAAALIATAQAAGVEISLRAAAALAETLLEVPPPPWPAATPRVARRAKRLSDWSHWRLKIGIDSPSVRASLRSYRWFSREVAQQDAPARALAGALGDIARPTVDDARRLGLGLPLAVHRLARPYFVASRFFGDLTGRSRE